MESRVTTGLVVLAIAALAAFVLWPANVAPSITAGEWTCSMHPQVRLPRPGSCPICGMTLVPVDRSSSDRANLESAADIATETVRVRAAWKEIRTLGRLDVSEARTAVISARVAGRIDRVYADFTGTEVAAGTHLVDIYSPDLLVAQQELLLATERAGNSALAEAARTKLALWGLLPDQIRAIEAERRPGTRVTLHAPIGGIVLEKAVREGQYVKDGDLLYRIAELDPLWLYLNVYEYDIAWVRIGQRVAVSVEAYPGEAVEGTVAFIEPVLDDATRTVRVRVNLANRERRLKPAMYAEATIKAGVLSDGSAAPTGVEGKYTCPMHPDVVRESPGGCPTCGMELTRVPGALQVPGAPAGALTVPLSAVLDTGRRQVAYRRGPDGSFALVELTIGPRVEAHDELGKPTRYVVVKSGLAAGDAVVARGGFLLDSQRQLEGQPSLFFAEPRGAAPAHAGHGGHGGH